MEWLEISTRRAFPFIRCPPTQGLMGKTAQGLVEANFITFHEMALVLEYYKAKLRMSQWYTHDTNEDDD